MLSTCREVQSLLPLFFDSELDARQMRAVALHSATCPECESELRSLETVQEAVVRAVAERVDEIDLSALWPTVEKQLGPAHPSFGTRLRLWWEERPPRWVLHGSLAGAAAVGFAIALLVLRTDPATSPQQIASPAVATPAYAENAVTVDSIDSDRNVALLKEPDALVLWLDEDPSSPSPDVPVSWESPHK
jgi:anti-sigma factor RsiW